MNITAIEKDLGTICCVLWDLNCIFVPTAGATALKLTHDAHDAHDAKFEAGDFIEIWELKAQRCYYLMNEIEGQLIVVLRVLCCIKIMKCNWFVVFIGRKRLDCSQ